MKSIDMCSKGNVHHVIATQSRDWLWDLINAVETDDVVRYDTAILAVAKVMEDELVADEELGDAAAYAVEALRKIVRGEETPDYSGKPFGRTIQIASRMEQKKSASHFCEIVDTITCWYSGSSATRIWNAIFDAMHPLIDAEEDMELPIKKTRNEPCDFLFSF